MAVKKKKKTSERAFVAISQDSHAIIKDHVEKEGYNLGRFVELAAVEKVMVQKALKGDKNQE